MKHDIVISSKLSDEEILQASSELARKRWFGMNQFKDPWGKKTVRADELNAEMDAWIKRNEAIFHWTETLPLEPKNAPRPFYFWVGAFAGTLGGFLIGWIARSMV